MDENYQSEWTKSDSLKEQKKIIKRLMKFAKPFRKNVHRCYLICVCPVCDQCPDSQGSSKLYG